MSEASEDDFLKANEMMIGFYIQKIRDHVAEFNNAYAVLSNLNEGDLNRDLVWEALHQAADAVWRITQTIWPVERRKATKEQRELTKRRGIELQRLFALTLGDRKNVNDFRNRLVHYDEDFDDWYLSSLGDEVVEDKRVVWRGISNASSPVHTLSNCVVQHYDYGWGVFYAFGKPYSLRAFKSLVETIEERLPIVDEYVEKVVPNRMRITIV